MHTHLHFKLGLFQCLSTSFTLKRKANTVLPCSSVAVTRDALHH